METLQLVWVIGVLAAVTIGAAAANIRRRRRVREVALPVAKREGSEAVRNGSAEAAASFGEVLRGSLGRDLGLAAEHVYSIRSLLEIARQHQQQIPPAALTNLELVSKHLVEMQRRVISAAEGAAREPAVSALAHRPKI